MDKKLLVNYTIAVLFLVGLLALFGLDAWDKITLCAEVKTFLVMGGTLILNFFFRRAPKG